MRNSQVTFTLKLELSEHQFKLMSQALTDLTTAIAAETTAITALTSAVTTIPVGVAFAGTPDAALVPLTAQVNTNAAAVAAATAAIQAAVTPPPTP